MIRLLPFLFIFFLACSGDPSHSSSSPNTPQDTLHKDSLLSVNYIYFPEENTLANRFPPPFAFERVPANEGSFADFLRSFPLKHDSSAIYFHDGARKWDQSAQCGILDIDIGKDDLQQCADAVIRLRAEYLFATKQYDKIHFNLTNGFRMDYNKWREGYRLKVNGNKTNWFKSTSIDTSHAAFRKYLNVVFMYAGTHSLSKELVPRNWNKLEPGDVLIQGGFPGHAVIVMDVAIHSQTNERKYMLAQSFMPAQSIHLLVNPNATSKEWCWYSNKEITQILTPNWTFYKSDLKTWKTD